MSDFCKRASIERTFDNLLNTESFCCKMAHINEIGGKEIKKAEMSLSRGKRIHECNICWDAEKSNTKSWRKLGNEFYKFHKLNIYKKIELFFDNTCDSKCIYCNAQYSSQWLAELKNTEYTPPNFAFSNKNINLKNNNSEKIFDYISTTGYKQPNNLMTEIVLLGGEPMLTTVNKKNLLELCITSFYKNSDPNKSLTIGLQTNCNTPTNLLKKTIKQLKDYKKTFKNLHIYISVSGESTEKNYEYVRHGSSYKRYVDNLNMWLAEGFDISTNMSINCVSIIDTLSYFKFFVNLCKKYNLRSVYISANTVYQPEELSVNILDKRFLVYLDECIEYMSDKHGIIGNVEEVIFNLNSFKKQIGTKVDRTRKTVEALNYFTLERNVHFKDVNPELFNYLNEKGLKIVDKT